MHTQGSSILGPGAMQYMSHIYVLCLLLYAFCTCMSTYYLFKHKVKIHLYTCCVCSKVYPWLNLVPWSNPGLSQRSEKVTHILTKCMRIQALAVINIDYIKKYMQQTIYSRLYISLCCEMLNYFILRFYKHGRDCGWGWQAVVSLVMYHPLVV